MAKGIGGKVFSFVTGIIDARKARNDNVQKMLREAHVLRRSFPGIVSQTEFLKSLRGDGADRSFFQECCDQNIMIIEQMLKLGFKVGNFSGFGIPENALTDVSRASLLGENVDLTDEGLDVSYVRGVKRSVLCKAMDLSMGMVSVFEEAQKRGEGEAVLNFLQKFNRLSDYDSLFREQDRAIPAGKGKHSGRLVLPCVDV